MLKEVERASAPFSELPASHYSCIVADPPWKFVSRSEKGEGRSASQHYGVMDLQEIKALPVETLAAPDAMLLMWAINPMLPQALDVMKDWGFEFKTVGFVWAKTTRKSLIIPKYHMGMGYYTRCLTADTRVHILDFERQIVCNVSIADLDGKSVESYMIWTHTGWQRVKDFVRNDATVVANITTRIGRTASSLNHKWAIKRLSTRRIPGSPTRRTAHHVIEYHELSDIRRRLSTTTVTTGNGSVNFLFPQRPIEHPQPIKEVAGFALTEAMGWLVGLFCAEGNYGHAANAAQCRFSLGDHEMKIAERVCEIVDQLNLMQKRFFRQRVIGHIYDVRGRNGLCVHFSSVLIRQFFEAFILGIGAHGKRLNLALLLQTPAAFRHAVLEGMLQGDGTTGPDAGYKNFRNLRLCNQGLVSDFRELSHGLGIMTSDLAVAHQRAGNGTMCTSYGFRFASPRNKDLVMDDVPVVPIEIKSIVDDPVPRVTYDLSVVGEAFVADWMVSHNSNSEICLLGTKGNPKRISRAVRQLIVAPIREHSRKPDVFYDSVVALAHGPRLELFSRASRDGWDGWGNEMTKFDANQGVAQLGDDVGPIQYMFDEVV